MCVLGLCALIDMEQIPQVLNQVSGQILPAFILLFNGLKRAYACHAEHENDSDDDDDAEDDEETGKGFALLEQQVHVGSHRAEPPISSSMMGNWGEWPAFPQCSPSPELPEPSVRYFT